jgi:hypothetical protein
VKESPAKNLLAEWFNLRSSHSNWALGLNGGTGRLHDKPGGSDIRHGARGSRCGAPRQIAVRQSRQLSNIDQGMEKLTLNKD